MKFKFPLLKRARFPKSGAKALVIVLKDIEPSDNNGSRELGGWSDSRMV